MTGYVTIIGKPATLQAGFVVYKPGTVIHTCLVAVYTIRYILLVLPVKPNQWN